jgi:T5orf172 domain
MAPMLFGGVVYFITDGEAIKIGVTGGTAEYRMKAIQASHHRPLTVIAQVPGDEDYERSLHHQFRHLRIRGEWFRDTPELRKFIASLSLPKPKPKPKTMLHALGIPEEHHAIIALMAERAAALEV